MKYLLLLAVIWIAIWLWRKNRREEMRDAQRERMAKAQQRHATPPAVAAPQAMVRCAHCGLHLPASDAVASPDGAVYCSPAHRQAAAEAHR
ncbi:PP0621 family protein [Variovorax boronicumulans]|uniref:PP0621 family protein n=1 Tax=Variovorax boronicumulans TaxID=436515 RepID=UPI0033928526